MGREVILNYQKILVKTRMTLLTMGVEAIVKNIVAEAKRRREGEEELHQGDPLEPEGVAWMTILWWMDPIVKTMLPERRNQSGLLNLKRKKVTLIMEKRRKRRVGLV